MNSMKHKVQVSDELAVREVLFGVKDETMKAVLHQREEEKAAECAEQEG